METKQESIEATASIVCTIVIQMHWIENRRSNVIQTSEPHLPRGGLEKVGLAVHQFRSKFGHLLLHLSHLGVEPLADAGKLRVDHAEVAELDRDVALVCTVGHFSPACFAASTTH